MVFSSHMGVVNAENAGAFFCHNKIMILMINSRGTFDCRLALSLRSPTPEG